MGVTVAFLMGMIIWPGDMAAQPVSSDVVFDDLSMVVPIGSEKLLLTTMGGAYKAKIYDIEADSVISRFLREGKGPGESPGIVTAGYHRQKGEFILLSRDGRLLATDLKGKVLREKTVGMTRGGHLSISSPDIHLFLSFSVPREVIRKDLPVYTAIVLDLDEFSIEDTLAFRPSELGLNNVEAFKSANRVSLDFIGHKIDRRTLLFSYRGANNLYLARRGKIVAKKQLKYPFKVGFEETDRQGISGIRTPAVLTHLQPLENGTMLFSIGNIHQEMPFGAIYVSVSGNDTITAIPEIIYKDLDLINDHSIHVIEGRYRVWFSRYYFTGHSLMIETLEE